MADKATEKSIAEEEKRIKGDIDHKIKMKIERKNAKEKLEKECRGQEVLRLHLQERWILNLEKIQDQEMK